MNNYDWDDDWIFYDSRFNLSDGKDEVFLQFLCETIHPEVRSNEAEIEKLCRGYNCSLKNDGYEIVPITKMAGRFVYSARKIKPNSVPPLNTLKQKFSGANTGYVSDQIIRMESAVENDPELAIGTAKELIETVCKDILEKNDVEFSNNDDLPKLTKKTAKTLKLTPDDIDDKVKATEVIKRLLSNLATISDGIAQLRNHYGTGHGKNIKHKGLTSRHAKLIVGAASTLAIFLLETHEEKSNIDKDSGTKS